MNPKTHTLNELALFAGAGGGILGGKLLGWRTVCAVEINAFCARRLCQRQNEGHLSPFPIWDDVSTFDGHPWRGRVDVVSGGFPCQDISSAGKGAGISGKRSGLWSQMARIIGEVRPRFALLENSPMLTIRGLGEVLRDLAEMGYDARWGVLGHDDIGGQHARKRIWIVADRNQRTVQQLELVNRKNREQWSQEIGRKNWIDFLVAHDGDAYPAWRCNGQGIEARPIMRRSPNGVAADVDRLEAIGNGQVPAVVALAWQLLAP